MSIVKLPGLKILINEISQSHNLPQTTVEDALREAIFKGYERFRRSKRSSMDHGFGGISGGGTKSGNRKCYR